MSPNIIFKNQHFVIVDKPVATLSVPSRLGRQDPRPVAGIILQEFLGIQVYPLHRLDEDTSGLLMFGLSAAASRAGNQWFEGHQILKTYEALSRPIDPADATVGRLSKDGNANLCVAKGEPTKRVSGNLL